MSRYVFHELIGTGGMGEVWRATDTTLNREVAIKLLKPEHAEDPIGRSRFESEAKHAAALHHSNVVAVYDVGEMPTASGLMRPYLVMELVDHKPLSELLRGGRPLDPEVVRDLISQAADALGAAHRAGIVHRDVKPANLLITPQRKVKVTDFGIARAQAATGITGTGQVMGTPQYLSPEQARGEKATPASDVYSLGVVLFECLAGQRPFQKETPVATAIAHLHDPVPPLPDNIPADLRAMVDKCLQKDPSKRYPDAGALAIALQTKDAGEDLDDGPDAATMVAPLTPPAEATAVMAPMAAAPGQEYGQDYGQDYDDEYDPTGATRIAPAGGPMSLGGPGGPRYQDPYERHDPYADEDERPWYKKPFNILLLVLLLALVIVAIIIISSLTSSGDSPSPVDNASTPPPTQTSQPAQQKTEPPAKKPVTIDEGDYIGRDVDEVRSELKDKGLKPVVKVQENDGSHEPDTVAGVSPTQNLFEGDQVTVRYYDEKPTPTETPTPTQPETTAPTDQTSPTDTGNGNGNGGGFSVPAWPGGGGNNGGGNG